MVVRVPDEKIAEAMRAPGNGNDASLAAIEMLIRGGFLTWESPWLLEDEYRTAYAIDFQLLAQKAFDYPSSTRAFLLLAASLAGWVHLRLDEQMEVLEREHLDLFLTAVACAAGQRGRTQHVVVDGVQQTIEVPPLREWPA